MTEMPPLTPSARERASTIVQNKFVLGEERTVAIAINAAYRDGFAAGVQAERAAIIARPAEWLTWAIETFGEIARDPTERCLRFVEEAIELAQAMGLSDADLCRIITRVLGREPGTPAKEIAQAQACLETLALVLGVDADAGSTAELARVKSIPREEWKRRHAAKVAIGIAR